VVDEGGTDPAVELTSRCMLILAIMLKYETSLGIHILLLDDFNFIHRIHRMVRCHIVGLLGRLHIQSYLLILLQLQLLLLFINIVLLL